MEQQKLKFNNALLPHKENKKISQYDDMLSLERCLAIPLLKVLGVGRRHHRLKGTVPQCKYKAGQDGGEEE